ncbi:N-sulfoglucosamine sulfohydrolase [Catalinimonas alkaloidigena]|uniref:sulfatase-like hydrolase/transferase n=1 Tax=Catalinimonas alkaloidigena TaxID=1075417 RepID=UPI0024074590|nr:sulfatase-like hydrolase/transferase [Catalinimonas alkaloidigena]MDF9798983.1 N-sulfoglucosamine sulfohydrolase [Catalinimonas alkaloidigena]
MNKNIRFFVMLAFLFVTLFATEGKGQQQDRPNILWIVSEDNSPLIGAYGDAFATTPNIDQLAKEGVLYENAFATAPVCAPSRSTLITGVYPTSMGTQHMRSTYPIPEMIQFYPRYLREAGYYTSNNVKKDYNTEDQPEAWDESSNQATYKNRKEGQPFFSIFNFTTSHESSIHDSLADLRHDPEQVPIPAYHPRTPEMKHDWAQYYDKVEDMDKQVGQVLQELEEAGLADNTIVFYYSDHGGVIGRSKRFMYESGLHIPLIIRFPEKYKHLAPANAGSRTDRLVTFVDFPPTILSLAGVPIPDYMQGKAFLGEQEDEPREYAYSFRGRMDERIDMVRSVRDKKYRYVRNFMPHKIYAQYIEYLWRAPSMKSWERAYKAGELNEVQSKFWETKPLEELYDVDADPDNVKNLADDPQHASVLKRMREANQDWMLDIRDVGFTPEAMMEEIAKTTTLYEFARSKDYPLKKIIKTIDMITEKDVKGITKQLSSNEPIVRYWAATACTIFGENASPAVPDLKGLVDDEEVSVRIAAAEALYHLGEKEVAVQTLNDALKVDNEMARVQAINVLETMEDDAKPTLSAVKALLPDNEDNRNYDVRAARRLVEKLEQ